MKPPQPPTTINEAITCWGTGAGGAAVVLRVQRASEGLATALPGPHPLLHRRSGYLSRGGMRLPAAAIPSSPPGSGPPPPPLGLGSPRWTRAPCTDPLARTRLPGPPRLVGSPLMLTISPPPPHPGQLWAGEPCPLAPLPCRDRRLTTGTQAACGTACSHVSTATHARHTVLARAAPRTPPQRPRSSRQPPPPPRSLQHARASTPCTCIATTPPQHRIARMQHFSCKYPPAATTAQRQRAPPAHLHPPPN